MRWQKIYNVKKFAMSVFFSCSFTIYKFWNSPRQWSNVDAFVDACLHFLPTRFFSPYFQIKKKKCMEELFWVYKKLEFRESLKNMKISGDMCIRFNQWVILSWCKKLDHVCSKFSPCKTALMTLYFTNHISNI